jgi:hypothetical protein
MASILLLSKTLSSPSGGGRRTQLILLADIELPGTFGKRAHRIKCSGKLKMKKLILLLALSWVVPGALFAAGTAADPAGAAMMLEAQRIVAAYHAGQPPATNLLRVVYFVPKDGEPLTNYAERLDRVVNDVSDFYRDAFRRFGIESAGLPLERKDGRLVIHLVRGQLPAGEYHYLSGDRTAEEIQAALKPTLDIAREHLLVFYALCRKTNDGRYEFDAPYYGSGSQRNGICHAADCELLDPLLLTDTNRTLVYTEHYYSRMKQTVAKFNSWYLGGVAHELGHGLGLPHDDGGEAEKSFGVSLMGEGNLTYREELWGGGPPTYLGRASVLQLLSEPLFTGSDRGRWDDLPWSFPSLKFSATNGTLRIEGVATDAIPAYAVIAYVWPDSDKIDDHVARTFPCVVNDDRFTLDLDGLKTDHWHRFHLVLSKLHVNGATMMEEFPLSYDSSSMPDVAVLNAEWLVDRAVMAVIQARPEARDFVDDAAIAAAPTPEAARKLRVLRTVLDPAAPFDLRTASGNSAFLSDAIWTDAQVGWGEVTRNHFWLGEQERAGVLLKLGGQFFDKGLYAHSSARYVFPVAGKWKTFTATVGLQDGAADQGSAIFTVRGDGKEMYRSKMLRVGQQLDVKVNIVKVKELELLTEGGEGHNHNSWAIWAEPKVQR